MWSSKALLDKQNGALLGEGKLVLKVKEKSFNPSY